MNRREYLIATGATLASIALAGCGSPDGGDGNETTTEDGLLDGNETTMEETTTEETTTEETTTEDGVVGDETTTEDGVVGNETTTEDGVVGNETVAGTTGNETTTDDNETTTGA